MADKKTHFGRAGEFYAMSELLLRGWNVAVPVVDVGDDVFVIDDNDKTTWRLQVKSADSASDPRAEGLRANFSLSRAQLRTPQPIELFYMLMIRVSQTWRYLIIPRADLIRHRDEYMEASEALEIAIHGAAATGWGVSLAQYLDRWPDALAAVIGGPGTTES